MLSSVSPGHALRASRSVRSAACLAARFFLHPYHQSSNVIINDQIFSSVNHREYQSREGKLGKYAIELEIDSNEAFDYENPENAKYTVDDL